MVSVGWRDGWPSLERKKGKQSPPPPPVSPVVHERGLNWKQLESRSILPSDSLLTYRKGVSL